ncbi:LysR family transcriptional regulator [Variovorax sp. J31P207]|uniref:helix-turn-helix domain-containing protein n=1 Tax=Variovorax sp. J31P207 TaxID=3053510 RepID=UPI0025784915|nr:LysR family transcriptional regulator [Variovorax sp. J31P207]MDM0072695.1 LysR family transcriptional regulator [Variovorax sp. J31P207]
MGGVSRAAEQLHVTPGAVSQQLKQPETAIGVKLFRKAGRDIEPRPTTCLAHGRPVRRRRIRGDRSSAIRQARATSAQGNSDLCHQVAGSSARRLLCAARRHRRRDRLGRTLRRSAPRECRVRRSPCPCRSFEGYPIVLASHRPIDPVSSHAVLVLSRCACVPMAHTKPASSRATATQTL